MRTIAVILLLGAATALAESSDPSTIALGFMTEHADAVVVVRAGSESAQADGRTVVTDFDVVEVLRGDAPAPPLRVLRPESAPPWEAGATYLAFLVRSGPETWIPLHATLGLRRLDARDGGIPFPDVVREISAALDSEGRVVDPDRLRSLLVQWMCDPGSGVSWSAATDFVRHAELHAGLTRDQAGAIVAAYAREPVGKATKRALALAAAATRLPAAGDALVDSLLLPRAREIRTTVVEALVRLGDARVPERIEAALTQVDEEQRISLLTALAGLGDPAGLRLGRGLLSDPSPRVRAVAAQTLGLCARVSRRADPDRELEGRGELEDLVKRGRGEDELKAGLWALAQLDQPEAWAFLRRTAADDEREVARRYAARFLESPRQSLILGGE